MDHLKYCICEYDEGYVLTSNGKRTIWTCVSKFRWMNICLIMNFFKMNFWLLNLQIKVGASGMSIRVKTKVKNLGIDIC